MYYTDITFSFLIVPGISLIQFILSLQFLFFLLFQVLLYSFKVCSQVFLTKQGSTLPFQSLCKLGFLFLFEEQFTAAKRNTLRKQKKC